MQVSVKLSEIVLKNSSHVKLNCLVRTIEQKSKGTKIVFDDLKSKKSKTVFAKYCIITIPPPMLMKLTFNPPLPPKKEILSQRTHMGAIIKIFMIYEKPFWLDMGYSGEVFLDTGPVANYYDASDHSKKIFALIGLIGGKYALKCLEMTKEERKHAVLEQLHTLFGDIAKKGVRDYVEKDWISDEFRRGGYLTIYPPNTFSHLFPEIFKSHGRIYFAGTESAHSWNGYMEGALNSAEKTTNEVLNAMKREINSNL